MAESAALLVDEVFPEQPVRQWGEGRPFVQWASGGIGATSAKPGMVWLDFKRSRMRSAEERSTPNGRTGCPDWTQVPWKVELVAL